MTGTLNKVPCPGCSRRVEDQAPACPSCGEAIYIEHPGDILGVKHRQLDFSNQSPFASLVSLVTPSNRFAGG